MPKIAELKQIDGAVWARLELTRNTEIVQQMVIWSEDDIKYHDEQLLKGFVMDLVENFLDRSS